MYPRGRKVCFATVGVFAYCKLSASGRVPALFPPEKKNAGFAHTIANILRAGRPGGGSPYPRNCWRGQIAMAAYDGGLRSSEAAASQGRGPHRLFPAAGGRSGRKKGEAANAPWRRRKEGRRGGRRRLAAPPGPLEFLPSPGPADAKEGDKAGMGGAGAGKGGTGRRMQKKWLGSHFFLQGIGGYLALPR